MKTVKLVAETSRPMDKNHPKGMIFVDSSIKPGTTMLVYRNAIIEGNEPLELVAFHIAGRKEGTCQLSYEDARTLGLDVIADTVEVLYDEDKKLKVPLYAMAKEEIWRPVCLTPPGLTAKLKRSAQFEDSVTTMVEQLMSFGYFEACEEFNVQWAKYHKERVDRLMVYPVLEKLTKDDIFLVWKRLHDCIADPVANYTFYRSTEKVKIIRIETVHHIWYFGIADDGFPKEKVYKSGEEDNGPDF